MVFKAGSIWIRNHISWGVQTAFIVKISQTNETRDIQCLDCCVEQRQWSSQKIQIHNSTTIEIKSDLGWIVKQWVVPWLTLING